MQRDTLFLLSSNFEDEAYPSVRFVCPSCTFFEGLLSVFPILLEKIEVTRIAFVRPRSELVALVGTDNQSCPTLVLGKDSNTLNATGEFKGVSFVKGQNAISQYLVDTYNIAIEHP